MAEHLLEFGGTQNLIAKSGPLESKPVDDLSVDVLVSHLQLTFQTIVVLPRSGTILTSQVIARLPVIELANDANENMPDLCPELAAADLVLVLTDHDVFPWDAIERVADKVLDTRNRLVSADAEVL